MKPRFFLLALLIVSLFGLLYSCSGLNYSISTKKHRNVLLISLDTCRADYLEPYGSTITKTPALNQLARDGILFTDAVTSVPLTVPSHCTLFTGLHPIQHGVRDNFNHSLSDSAVTIAELFRENGYTTAGVIGAMLLSRQNGFMQGFDFYDDHFTKREFYMQRATVERRAERVIASANEWLSAYRAQKNNPFFLFLHFYDPHMLYDPPPPFAQEYAKHPYAGEIAYVDRELGTFIQRLRDEGLYEDMWIVLIGDHGEGLGDHKEHTHGLFLYEECVRVPFIVKPPKNMELGGSKVGQTVSLADVVPTLIDLCDLGPVETYGKSLAPWMKQQKAEEERGIVLETLYPLTYKWSPLYSWRSAEWKYVHAPKPELYNLLRDPQEKKNVIGKHPTRVLSMKTKLENALIQLSLNKPFEATLNVRPENAEILASLGYVGGGSAEGGDGLESDLPDPKDKVDIYLAIDEALGDIVRGDYMNAIRAFHDLRQQDPQNPSPILNLGLAYAKMRNYGKAIHYTKKALEMNPKSIMIQMQLSRFYLYNKQNDKARDILFPVVEEHPKLAEAHFQLGIAALNENQFQKALEYFEQTKEWLPDMPGLDERIREAKDSM